MPVYVDQLMREIEIVQKPRRIVSLVPSQTELLYDLGLDTEVVGITQFCTRPEQWYRTRKRIGGTKTVKTAEVALLQPDLIIANKEENIREQVTALGLIAPVWVSDVNTVTDALEMIKSIGAVVGKEHKATELATQIEKDLSAMKYTTAVRTAYLIWKDPFMAAGGDTFISNMLQYGGFENVLNDVHRYPPVTPTELTDRGVELVLLSSEPYPFKAKHAMALRAEMPGVKIALADGEMFSWYGSRMLHAAAYLRQLRQEWGI